MQTSKKKYEILLNLLPFKHKKYNVDEDNRVKYDDTAMLI